MKTHKPPARSVVLVLLVVFAFTAAASPTWAASMNHGNFPGDTVMFLGVTEASATDPLELFGRPDVIADQLQFLRPLDFDSHSGGPGAGSDITDGQLLLTIMATAGNRIDQITITENGDYTLLGPPGAYAFASVATPLFYRVIELDGVPAAGPSGMASVAFNPPNGDFDLAVDGVAIGQQWTGEHTIDIADLLVNRGIHAHATKVVLTLDNVLATAHANGGSASISKKEFLVEVNTVPEPSALALAALGALGLAALVRRSRRACN